MNSCDSLRLIDNPQTYNPRRGRTARRITPWGWPLAALALAGWLAFLVSIGA